MAPPAASPRMVILTAHTDALSRYRPEAHGGGRYAAIVGGDVPVADRARRAAELLGLNPAQVDAALGYYAEFTDEIDRDLAANTAAADEAEALWRRRQDLLAG